MQVAADPFTHLLAEVQRLHDRLSTMQDAIDAVADDVADLMARQLKASDQHDLAILLPIARRRFGIATWTVAELVIAGINMNGQDGDDLREIVSRYTTASGGSKRLGKLLARCAGRTAGGLRLVKESRGGSARDSSGELYSVRVVRGFEAPPNTPASSPSRVASPTIPASPLNAMVTT
jgi:hypothetical protein